MNRALIGSVAGSDNGRNPPFGATRAVALVGFTARGLANAYTATLPAGAAATLIERTPPGTASIVVELQSTEIQEILQDQGAGRPPWSWTLNQPVGPAAALLIFDPKMAQLTSLVAVDGGAAAAVREHAGRLIVTGRGLRVYRGPGEVAAQATQRAVFDAATGRLVSTG
jgi:hypothetical protein